jgi:hypothetical protein
VRTIGRRGRRVFLGAAAVILCAAAGVVVAAFSSSAIATIAELTSGAMALSVTAVGDLLPAAVRDGSLGGLVAGCVAVATTAAALTSSGSLAVTACPAADGIARGGRSPERDALLG